MIKNLIYYPIFVLVILLVSIALANWISVKFNIQNEIAHFGKFGVDVISLIIITLGLSMICGVLASLIRYRSDEANTFTYCLLFLLLPFFLTQLLTASIFPALSDEQIRLSIAVSVTGFSLSSITMLLWDLIYRKYGTIVVIAEEV
jgi:cytochrome bd-type quinol oxidase subunit 2